MRKSIARFIALPVALLLAFAAFTADAQTTPSPRELTFQLLDARIQKIDPPQRTRRGKYDLALVLRLEVDRTQWENLPPAIETYLYLGKHELRPFANVLDGARVVITFHDPDWKDLEGGEPMVLTTEHGDPVNHPEKYVGYPRFDPKMISEK